MTPATPPRLYLLDTLRGLASLSVVVWHYQHFFFVAPGTLDPNFSVTSQPFYSLLAPFYLAGYAAVPLFFSLSGFVFFLIYSDALGNGKIGLWKFFVLRFSRLYPLHFAMLLLVALGQYLSWRNDGQFIVYPYNDTRHFVLNLLFASDWGLQKGFSFNSPVWSVSVEVLLYAMFFVFAYSVVPRVRSWIGGPFSQRVVPIMVAIAVAAVAQKTLPVMELRTVASAAVSFFLGGLVYVIWDVMRARSARESAALALIAAAVVVVSIAVYALALPNDALLRLATFPPLILALALSQSLYPNAGRATRLIGDVTYSTYLIHFPIQLAILLGVKQWRLAIDFHAPLAFVGFAGAVVLLSIPTYYGFELPMQTWLRSKLLPRPGSSGKSNGDWGAAPLPPSHPAASFVPEQMK